MAPTDSRGSIAHRLTMGARKTAVALLTGAAVLGAAAVVGPTPRAAACGGLFCSSAMPVNQAAERIIFAHDKAAKKVTAVVEILYSGPSEKFAWILPVPGIPTVGVSTSAMLDRLQQLTNPTYSLQRTWEGSTCEGRGGSGGSSAGAPSSPGAAGPGGSSDPSVSVLAAGAVGPYVYEVIKVDAAMSDPAMVALNWLTANKYEVGALGADVLRPYLRDGLNLLAFKLAKNKMAGSIRPVMLTYDALHPMIPIRPTAVAANKDMGILAFVLADTRSVSTNYKNLELNEAMIDWFNPGPTYNQVITLAANEAGGQGFVTEFAQPTNGNQFAQNLYQEQFAVAEFRRVADTLAPADLVVKTIETFASFAQGNLGGPFGSRPSSGRFSLDGVADVMAQTLTIPPGVNLDDFLAAPRCYLAAFRQSGNFYCQGRPAPAQAIELTGFDKVAFLTAVESLVVKPLEATAQLFIDRAFLTRLYTTLSAEEMTLDPEFDTNSELGTVANVKQITLKYTKGCAGDVSGPWEADIGGLIVRGEGTTWPVDLTMAQMPFNRRVTQLGTSGTGVVVKDNTMQIAAALGGKQPMASGTPAKESDDGCAVSGRSFGRQSGAVSAWALFAAFALWLSRRRRR